MYRQIKQQIQKLMGYFSWKYFIVIALYSCALYTNYAQEILTGLYKNAIIEDSYNHLLRNQKSSVLIYYEPILIPFIDDFSNYTGYPDTALWIGKQAFINQSFSIDPPTIGCATLDAVNEKGELYEHASIYPFGADTLLSKPIRLDSIFSPLPSALTPADSVSFYFYYQPGGGDGNPWEKLGDVPEKNDSLILEFGYQSGNTELLYYMMRWVYPTDTVNAGDTIYSNCNPDVYIIADQSYFPGDSLEFPCDSVTAMETVWEQVWASGGMSLKSFVEEYGVYFRQVRIPIVDAKYFNRGFQFRFRNYASVEFENNNPYWGSNVDFWNIDYIRLDKGFLEKDSVIDDIAIVNNPGSFLLNYTAMPWKQFVDNQSSELDTAFHLKLTNLYDQPKNTTYNYYILDEGGNIIKHYEGGTENLEPFYMVGYENAPAHNTPPIEEITFPNSANDSIAFLIQHVFREGGSGDRNPKNDTVLFLQKFYNYFAYDDGTPEAGYLITSSVAQKKTSLALGFTLNKPDTLRAIDIYVNHTMNEVSAFDFTLTVWTDDNGQPGQELYTALVQQKFSDELYGFQRFYIDEPFVVSRRVYIGYQTTDGKFLNVGYDQNNNSSQHVFFRSSGEWSPSFIFGTPMLRPVLGKELDRTFITVNDPELEVKIYPNPAKDKLFIELSQELQSENIIMSIYSVTGQKIYESRYCSEISLSNYVPGFYLLQLTDGNNRHIVRKFLIGQ
ncbi:MAG: T9SS type A sorting domain-containing protein [Bacteroidales bacterium]|jgi:hypothetical protein|nr:T9SS type A sorting domain-containing protein [Bacteroidales bacterium]